MPLRKGFTLVEILIVLAIFGIMMAGGSYALFTSQSVWSTTNTQIRLRENVRQTLLRISKELQETGKDKADNLQLTITDGAGPFNSDILKFSIPICLCRSVLDDDTDVAMWGAPLTWGETGCSQDYSVSGGTVTICHIVSEVPFVVQTMNVNPGDVDAHLAHGDTIGACPASCSADNRKYIEYSLDANSQLIRKVLDISDNMVRQDIFAEDFTDFQAALNADGDVVTLTLDLSKGTNQNRIMDVSQSLDVPLKNVR